MEESYYIILYLISISEFQLVLTAFATSECYVRNVCYTEAKGLMVMAM
jgi:hypothetical protein